MRVALVCDPISPISSAWADAVRESAAADVAWSSTDGARSGDLRGRESTTGSSDGSIVRRMARAIPHSSVRSAVTRAVRLTRLPAEASRLRAEVTRSHPDLVHGLRIPFEGITCALALRRGRIPLAVSVWGNDFTLHARESASVMRLTRLTLGRADGLHSDCERDQRLAQEHGWDPTRPSLVVPGSGGINPNVFHSDESVGRDSAAEARFGGGPWIMNPRGIRSYVETGAFLAAIPLIVAKFPGAVVLMPGTEGHAEAERLRRRSPMPERVHLLPALRPAEMASLFRSCEVFVSPSRHDGTPNTLLEGMACGCYPIVGDVESVREWVVDGVNGCVLRDLRPETIGEAVIAALSRDEARRVAAERNAKIIAERAERRTCMRRVKEFYEAVVEYGKARHRN